MLDATQGDPDDECDDELKRQVRASRDKLEALYSVSAGLDNFQKQALGTAIYPLDARIWYPALGLAGEAGEVANKVKKMYRDGGGLLSPERQADIAGEIGDVLWYCAALAKDLDLTLGQIAKTLLLKLAERKARNAIQGSGDKR